MAGTEHPQQMVLLHIRKQLRWQKGTYTLEAYAQGAQSDVTMQILNAEDESVLFTGEATAMTALGRLAYTEGNFYTG